MAEARRYGLTPQLDIEKILSAAQDRWLRPAEICEILQNYKKFHIAPEPPNRPPSGSLFLFDRKVLRYFRKDGHNWRKKKDGKTVKEAHERLKAGSIDVLHCYYAHGEDSNFQRRTYWMLEEEFLHIVLVHYRKVKNKESYVRPRDVLEITQTVLLESPSTSNSSETYNQRKWQATNAESPNSIQTSDCEDSGRDFQESSRYNPLAELLGSNGKPLMDTNSINPFPQVQQQQRQDIAKIFDEIGSGLTVNGPRETALTSWDEVGEYCEEGCEDTSFPTTFSSSVAFEMEVISRSVNMPVYENGAAEIGEVDWQNTDQELDYAVTGNFSVKNAPTKEGKAKYHPLLKQLSLDFPNIEGGKGLQKHDSFSRWMSKELGEVDETHIHAPSTSGIYWEAVERESIVNGSTLAHQDHIDTYLLSPSLSQYQFFSIDDFSPNWSYSGTSSKILIAGSFLLNKNDIDIYNWSCMFGEVEVPAEVLADGLLQCHAPPRKSGRVPFYITCSNRLACSEVRDFEYRDEHVEHLDTSEPYSGNSLEIALYLRFEKFLSEVPPDSPISSNWKIHIFNKISSLLTRSDDGVSQKMLKEKLHAWLLHKVAEDGKGPNILDKEGQGVIHLAAALGYDWAIPPTIVAGVNINFRDKHGWTALHWAASCGREHTVVTLLSLQASPGALTDPTTEFPSGRTPADLAAKSGHKGIAGFLAQSSLTSHLSSLTLKQSGENSFSDIFDFPNTEELAKRYSIRVKDGDALKDSLGAVRSATQAAARIHQVFRVQSFHRKEQVKYGDDKFGISNERAISLLSVKPNKANAAIRIQKKFRGWKGRKEFLVIRQRIVKIQAHVRGHQVRKHFRKFVWTVAIVMKAIRRWRGKESGLREFRSERSAEEPAMQVVSAKEDDYDLLQAGRKQTEARSERALERVKSMVQYQESRDQYRRLLIGVEEFQETKVILERILNDSEETSDNEMLFDIDELLEDDNFMPTSSNSVGSSAC